MRGRHRRALTRRRGELLERLFAHELETGGMRRTHVRGRGEVLNRMLCAAAGFDIGLPMRALFGVGKPRTLQGATRKARKEMVKAVEAGLAPDGCVARQRGPGERCAAASGELSLPPAGVTGALPQPKRGASKVCPAIAAVPPTDRVSNRRAVRTRSVQRPA